MQINLKLLAVITAIPLLLKKKITVQSGNHPKGGRKHIC